MEIWQRIGAKGAPSRIPASRHRAIHTRARAMRGDGKAARPRGNDVGLTEGTIPREARGEKTAATGNLAAAMEDIDRLLEKGLDKLMLQFKTTDFYPEYQLARDPVAVAK